MGAKVRFMGEEGMQKWFVIYHHIWGFFFLVCTLDLLETCLLHYIQGEKNENNYFPSTSSCHYVL